MKLSDWKPSTPKKPHALIQSEFEQTMVEHPDVVKNYLYDSSMTGAFTGLSLQKK